MEKQKQPELTRRKFLSQAGMAAATLSAAAVPAAQALGQGSGAPKRPAAPKKLRIGVVGGGFGRRFQWHLHPDCSVVAVCDKREDRLQLLKEAYGSDNLYKDYAEFLKHPGLDAVALFTPAPFHAEMVVQAFKQGKHVISAVPAGLSVEELEMLLDAVKQTGLKYMMAETSRYRQDVLTAIDLARAGKFGTIFYSESEYHHSGSAPYAYGSSFDCQTCMHIENIDQLKKFIPDMDLGKLSHTWAWGYPPMLYPTHCTGMIVPVTGERLTEVTAYGWGDDHEMLKKNTYGNNPFFHTVALFKTSKGNSARVSIGWQIAAGQTERATFYGDRMSYIAQRPEGSPPTIVEQKDVAPFGLYTGIIESRATDVPNHFDRLPEPLRVTGQHGGAEPFITHEFVRAVIEDRHPEVNIWEAIAYTMPGIIAHQSALEGGRRLNIRDYGQAPT